MIYIAYIVLILSFLNLLRMGAFLVGSDIYDIKKNLAKNKSSKAEPVNSRKRTYAPLVTVLVPAHNEEVTLRRNLDSIYGSTYKNIELIVINDSSTDRTYNIARNFQRKFKNRFKRIKVINVQLRGKARALNAGLQHARGTLFMCLDADSTVTPEAIKTAVREFEDPLLACTSANIKIFPNKGVLNIFQRLEYLMCYQMKKTETVAGVQYIVGGIGSTFRTKIVRQVGMYDVDTITEDMDLSMKIISRYGKKYKIGYNPNIVTYTEQVYTFTDLLRQRFRWRYGAYQVFLKYKHLFYSTDIKQSKLLSWLYLPYAILGQVLCALEPIVLMFIAFLLFKYGSLAIVAASFLTFVFYTSMHITAATKGYTPSERIYLIAIAPIGYVGMYVLMFVEYVATVRGFKNFYHIYKNHKAGLNVSHWVHVERKQDAVSS